MATPLLAQKQTTPGKKVTGKDIRSNIKTATSQKPQTTPSVLGPSSTPPSNLGPTTLPFKTSQPAMSKPIATPTIGMKYGNTAPTTLKGLQQSASLPTPTPLPSRSEMPQTHNAAPLQPQQDPQKKQAFDAFNAAQSSPFGFAPNQPTNFYGGKAPMGSIESVIEMSKMTPTQIKKGVSKQMKQTRDTVKETVMAKLDSKEPITKSEMRILKNGADLETLALFVDAAVAEGVPIEGLNYEFPVEEKTGLAKTKENLINRFDTLNKQLQTPGATGAEKALNVGGMIAGTIMDPVNQALSYGMEKANQGSEWLDKNAPILTDVGLNPIASAKGLAKDAGEAQSGYTQAAKGEAPVPLTIKQLALTQAGEKGGQIMKRYEGLAKTDPRLKNAIDSGLPIADLATTVTGLGLAKKPVQQAIKAGAKEIAEGGAKQVVKGLAKEVVEKTPGLVREGVEAAGKGLKNARGAVSRTLGGANRQKKAILGVVQEGQNLASAKSALGEGRLVKEGKTWLGKKLFGEKGAVVAASKRSEAAADTIQRLIDRPNVKDPTKLYMQARSKVGEISDVLEPQLKKIDIGDMTDVKRTVKSNIEELSSLTDEFTAAERKKLDKVIYNIDLANNVDDMRKTVQEFDNLFPEAVKQATSAASPTTRKAHNLWMKVRTAIRDSMDEAADAAGNPEVREQFRDMSNLYHAMHNIETRLPELIKGKEGWISTKNIARNIVGGLGLAGAGKVVGLY